MMFTRRIHSALLVAIPTVAAGIALMQLTPLPNPLNVQWSGAHVTSTAPLWLFFLPIVAVTLLGLALAVAAVIDRDHHEPFRGTLYLAAVLTAGSAGVCLAVISMNLGYAAPTGPAFLGALAIAPLYALLPLAVLGFKTRRRSG